MVWNGEVSQHRWEKMVDPDEAVPLLWEAKKKLKASWNWDQQDPMRYPINTSYALSEIRASLSKRVRSYRVKTLCKPKKPRKLADLVPENLIKIIWEEQKRWHLYRSLKIEPLWLTSKGMKRARKLSKGLSVQWRPHLLLISWAPSCCRNPKSVSCTEG